MSSELAAPQNPTRERIKYALAAVLAIVLGVVVFQTMKPVTPVPPLRLQPVSAPADASGSPATQITGRTVWPRIELEQVIAFDPFSPRGVAPAAQTLLVESESEETAEMEPTQVAKPAARVQAIYRSGNRTAALIESRHVIPGEMLDGRRILEIDATSVLLEDPDSPPQK